MFQAPYTLSNNVNLLDWLKTDDFHLFMVFQDDNKCNIFKRPPDSQKIFSPDIFYCVDFAFGLTVHYRVILPAKKF